MLHDTLEYGPQGPTEARDAFNQLISSVSHRPKLSADTYLSRAIAFLLEARNTQPFQVGPSASQYYRMPDNPYSLFEGLAGTICAWAEVCVVITAKLEETDAKRGDNDKIPSSDGDLGDILQNKLGMPGLSVRGYL